MTMDPFASKNISELLENYPLTNLDPGKPRDAVYAKLKSLTVESLIEPRVVKDQAMADCCVCALWLWHNYLDESHKISQEIETSAGSAWHGIMHRREGDFWNANYWFARVRDTTLFPTMAVARESLQLGVKGSVYASKLHRLLEGSEWSPSDFTNEVELILQQGKEAEIQSALKIATAEWRVLFRSCWFSAIGMPGMQG
jgi:hypothetical protein